MENYLVKLVTITIQLLYYVTNIINIINAKTYKLTNSSFFSDSFVSINFRINKIIEK